LSERVIRIPHRLDRISSLLDLNIPNTDLSQFDSCRIDFTACGFGEPLPMLLLGRDLRALMRNNIGKRFSCTTVAGQFRGYADHVGFFRYCGFLRGNEIGEARGSSNYVPIQLIDLNEMKIASGERPYVEIVEEKSDELARVLLGSGQHGAFNSVRYSIREILRNSVEHSQGGVVIFFGQYWPNRSQAEIVIFDTGVGVVQTLLESGVVDGANQHQALRKALEPGITGVSAAERAAQEPNTRNSGFGLYVTSRYCSEFGTFRILSHGAALTVNNQEISNQNWRFSGTCVQMKIRTDLDNSGGQRILDIIGEGEQALEDSNDVAGASNASRSLSLRRD